jgi:hypothetical protein
MSAEPDLATAEWVRPSRSDANGGQCVEFSLSLAPSGAVPVRDSKNPHGPALVVPSASWGAFVRAVGRDRLAGLNR